MPAHYEYSVAYSQWSRESRRIPLPALVGSDPACDIIINAHAVDARAYAIHRQGKALQIVHLKSGKQVGPEALQRFGIQVSSPLRSPNKTLRGGSTWRELVAKEDLWLSRQPRWLRLGLGGAMQQHRRFAIWGLIASVVMVSTLAPSTTDAIDYSKTPIAIQMDHVSSAIIGVTTQRAGYENGALLTVVANADQARLAHLLSFRAAKLDMGKELRIFTTAGLVYESEAMPNCIKQFCEIKVRIPAGFLQEGNNEIQLVHDPAGEFYIIGDILLRPLPKITPDEIIRVKRWEKIANRAYNERKIVPENLVQVKRELDQAIDFLDTRAGGDTIRARIEAFRSEAEDAFRSEVKDRWAKVDINQKLKNFESAQFHLDRLRGLFPDTSSKEHQAVQNRISRIKEMQK